MEREALVVGLGNPGKSYDKTRHNVGFRIVETLAKKYGFSFHPKKKEKGEMASGTIGSVPVLLLKPLTFMNQSGEAVALVARYKEIDPSKILVVADDVDLPLGQIRMKINSSPGTHNGLKSIENHLHTNCYARLRIGVGAPKGEDLADYVLSSFDRSEEELLSQVEERAIRSIEIWLEKGITRAMDFANRRPPNPSNGE